MTDFTLTADRFASLTQESDKPVLVEFWAPWCTYCRRIAPAFELLARQWQDRLEFGRVSIDDEAVLAAREEIEVIPTLVLYRNGKALGSIVAPDSKAAIEEFIRTYGTE